MKIKRLLSFMLLAGALAACSPENDSIIVVSVDGPPSIPAFYYLRVIMTNGGAQDYHQFPVNGASSPITLPTSLGFNVPRARKGDVALTFDALNVQMQTVASGSGAVTLNVGGRVDLCVGLALSGAGCQNPNGSDAGVPLDGGLASPDAGTSFGETPSSQSGGFPPGLQFAAVSAGYDHTCAVTTGGDLWCWGGNSTGQIGNGNLADVLVPSKVAGAAWSNVTAGWGETCALQDTGSLWCWGNNGSGQVGGGPSLSTMKPVTIPLQVPGDVWSTASAGEYHIAAIQVDGSLWTWGANSSDQLGDSTAASAGRSSPSQAGKAQWVGIAAGSLHNCGIQPDHTMWCWGSNGAGQIGDGTTRDHIDPTQVPGSVWATATAGQFHSCALKTDGTLWCWGANANGQLGLPGAASNSVPSPTQVSTGTGASAWRGVDAGDSHTCGILADQSLWCWGESADGQLGVGSGTPSAIPVAVSPGSTWITVSAGGAHTCAIATDRTLWCWGKNTDGQLGTGGTVSRTSPTRLGQ